MTKTFRTLLLTIWILCLLFATAIADAASGAAVELDPMVQIAILAAGIFATVLTPIAIALGRYAARRFEAATGVDLTDDAERIARSAVALAEQRAKNRLASTGVRTPGGEKMADALRFFLDVAKKKKLPEWVQEHGEAWIEGQIASHGQLLEVATTVDVDGKSTTSAAASSGTSK